MSRRSHRNGKPPGMQPQAPPVDPPDHDADDPRPPKGGTPKTAPFAKIGKGALKPPKDK